MSPSIDAILSRYIFSQRHFSVAHHAVKYGAFMPPEDGRLSVFETEGLSSRETWQIGQQLAEARAQTLYARADIRSAAVVDRDLGFVIDEPPPRHRNIE